METFGKWLRKTRIDYNINLKHISDMGLGSISYISSIERCLKVPKESFITILANNLKLSKEQVKLAKKLLKEQRVLIQNKEEGIYRRLIKVGKLSK